MVVYSVVFIFPPLLLYVWLCTLLSVDFSSAGVVCLVVHSVVFISLLVLLCGYLNWRQAIMIFLTSQKEASNRASCVRHVIQEPVYDRMASWKAISNLGIGTFTLVFLSHGLLIYKI